MNLYWVTTLDHDEDYFVASSDKATAEEYFAGTIGIDPLEPVAERISNIKVKGDSTKYVQTDELQELGFTIINEACPTVVRYKSRVFQYDRGIQLAHLDQARHKNCVYLLQACGSQQFKIGITSNLSNRIRNIQTGNPAAIKIIAILTCPDPHTIESNLHKHFGGFRIHGEWFDLTNKQAMEVCVALEMLRQ